MMDRTVVSVESWVRSTRIAALSLTSVRRMLEEVWRLDDLS